MNISKLKKQAEKALKIERELRNQLEEEKENQLYSRLSDRSLNIIIAYYNHEEEPLQVESITDECLSKVPYYGTLSDKELEKLT